MKTRFPFIAITAVLLLGLASGCAKDDAYLRDPNAGAKGSQSNSKSKPKTKLEGEALLKKITEDVNKDIKAYTGTRENPKDYSQAFTGGALKSIQDQFNKDKTAGRLKVRVHNNGKIEGVDVLSNIGEAKYTFTDASYYVDIKTKAKISEPTNETQVFLLGLVEEDGRWKIATVLTPQKEDHPKVDPSTPMPGSQPAEN